MSLPRTLAVLALLALISGPVLADTQADWARRDREAHGNLPRMLAILRATPPIPQLRLERPAAEMAAALARAGRFAALGLDPAEGRVLVDALYRHHGRDPNAMLPPMSPEPELIDPPEGYGAGQEFAPLAAVHLRWPADWRALRDEYAEMIDAILRSGAQARIWVDLPVTQRAAAGYLRRKGVDLKEVQWIVNRTDSVWMRDYGPIYLYGEAEDDWAVVDFHYYDSRPADDNTPRVVAERDGKAVVDRQLLQTLYTEGGNINTDGLGAVIYSTRTYTRNPGIDAATVDARIASALATHQALVLEDPSLDSTGHVDMFSKIVGPSTVLVAQYDPDETDYAVLEDNAALLAAAVNGAGDPWQVVRIRQPDVYYQLFVYPVVRTYTNSLISNDRVIIPVYDIPDDADALAVYAQVFPDKILVPIDARDIITSGGAWHCVTMEFPQPGIF